MIKARQKIKLKAHLSQRPTIVIIDDDDFVAKDVYQVLLEREGYRVLTANNGLAGLNILKNEIRLPEMVLVDCSMPEMSGETFLMELKEKLPQIFSESKVIGLTCYDPRSPDFQRFKNLAFDCREKPSDIAGILQIVSDYIEKPSDCAYA